MTQNPPETSTHIARSENNARKDERFKILLCGPGLIGRKHAEVVRNSRRSVLNAIVGPPTEGNTRFSKALGVPLFDSIEVALDFATFDGAIVASPNIFHLDQALSCIASHLPVLVS